MARRQPITNLERSPYYGMLQEFVDSLFADATMVRRVDAVVLSEMFGLPDDLVELVALLPPGEYERETLTGQLNSSIAGHAWGLVYGTVV